jgi:competence protein ComFC
MLSKFFPKILGFLLPVQCANCRGYYQDYYYGLCKNCFFSIKIQENFNRKLDKERRELFKDISIYALFSYSGFYRDLIINFKIYQYNQLAFLLAYLFTQLPCLLRLINDGYIIVSAPSHFHRKCTMSEVALILQKKYKLPTALILQKTKCYDQKYLGKEARFLNIKNNIKIKKGCQVPNKVILIDDILTTGATLAECCHVLKEAGTQDIIIYTLTLADIIL